MQCPIDKTEMEKGWLSDNSRWVAEGGMTKRILPKIGIIGKNTDAYHCPKCGKVELTTEV